MFYAVTIVTYRTEKNSDSLALRLLYAMGVALS
jgi:hypothetical protein